LFAHPTTAYVPAICPKFTTTSTDKIQLLCKEIRKSKNSKSEKKFTFLNDIQ
jgi:hypothetical protein